MARAQLALVTPMAAQPVKALPEGKEWLYELKLDGYRALLLKTGSDVIVMSRNQKDLTRMYPTVAAAAGRLKADQAIVDGEIVALDDAGMPSFQALQHRALHPGHQIVFYAFDLLQLNRRDLTRISLIKRRAHLAKTVDPDAHRRLLQELPGSAEDVVQAVLESGLEGVVAKRRDSLYQPGERSTDWLKLVLERKQEFVIGGYRLDAPRSIGSLLVGYYEGKQLRFASRVHGGLTPHLRRELFEKLKPLETSRCPFSNLPNAGPSRWGGGVTKDQMREMHWSQPKLVAQIRFADWTVENRLRRAKFIGLRTDKAPKDVRRES
jgi:bifunctional non-homologous end joining protein LigD